MNQQLDPNEISALLAYLDDKACNFQDIIGFIESRYDYQPQAFTNGTLHNKAGENEGSCKVFAFAKIHNLSALNTLKLFAEHYDSVKAEPKGSNHANIRNFSFYGWEGFSMEHNCLTLKP